MTGTGVHLFKIPNAAFCLPSSVTLQSTKESICVWKLGWNTLSFLFYINVKSRKIELSSIFYQKRRARSFPRSEIFSEGRVDATRVLIFSSALRKFTYAISSHIRLNTLAITTSADRGVFVFLNIEKIIVWSGLLCSLLYTPPCARCSLTTWQSWWRASTGTLSPSTSWPPGCSQQHQEHLLQTSRPGRDV